MGGVRERATTTKPLRFFQQHRNVDVCRLHRRSAPQCRAYLIDVSPDQLSPGLTTCLPHQPHLRIPGTIIALLKPIPPARMSKRQEYPRRPTERARKMSRGVAD